MLRGGEAAYTDLNQPLDQTVFQDAGHGAGVSIAVTFEIGVQIRMCVEVQQTDPAVLLGESANYGIGDCMITAQDHEPRRFAQCTAYPVLDDIDGFARALFIRDVEIAVVEHAVAWPHAHASLGVWIT